MKNRIILVVGKSGTGKSTLVDTICAKLGFKNIKSYTTRQPRTNDCSHHFITRTQYNEFKSSGLIYTQDFIFGHYYFTTKRDIDSHHFYITSPKSANELVEKLKILNYDVLVLYFYASDDIRINRLRERGDSENEILNRFIEEYQIFKDFKYDLAFNTSYDFDDNYNRLKFYTLLYYKDELKHIYN